MKDYSPFDHGTQTKQAGDKFFKPNGATELNGDCAADFQREKLQDCELDRLLAMDSDTPL